MYKIVGYKQTQPFPLAAFGWKEEIEQILLGLFIHTHARIMYIENDMIFILLYLLQDQIEMLYDYVV